MKVGIDLRCLLEGRKTGVESYSLDVSREMIKQNPDCQFIIFINSYKKKRVDFEGLDKNKNVSVRAFKYPNRILNGLFWFFGWPKIDKMLGGVDVFFIPNFCFLSLSKKCKLIASVHDLSFERLDDIFSIKRNLWHFLVNPRRILKKADRIFAVSESTKDDCVSLYKIDSSRIEVMNPEFDFKDFSEEICEIEKSSEVRQKIKNTPNEFLLYLGTIEPRKNIISIVYAFNEIKKDPRFKNLHLIVAGKKGWLFNPLFNLLRSNANKDQIKFLGYVNEEEKIYLYKKASVFVYPSFFEGFGLPPLEAMATGIPVITSNQSSMPEILGDHALLIDPYRPQELLVALLEMLGDVIIRRRYALNGLERIDLIKNKKRNLKLK